MASTDGAEGLAPGSGNTNATHLQVANTADVSPIIVNQATGTDSSDGLAPSSDTLDGARPSELSAPFA